MSVGRVAVNLKAFVWSSSSSVLQVVLLAVPVLQDDEWSWSEVEVGS